jgi:hypothetical protein
VRERKAGIRSSVRSKGMDPVLRGWSPGAARGKGAQAPVYPGRSFRPGIFCQRSLFRTGAAGYQGGNLAWR